MRYVKAKIEKETLDKTYRIYVTDSLKMISENTAKFAGGNALSKRYVDFITKQTVETRTGEEIIDTIQDKLRKLG